MVRAARERARLSLEELAAQTRLARATLDALERDDFAALLEPVYVRGYYRKCAKVLELPEQELIRAYERRVVPRTPQPPAKLRLGTGGEGSELRRWGSFAVVAPVVALLIGVVMWYLRGHQEGLPPIVLSPAGGPAETPPAGAPAAPGAGIDVAPATAPIAPAAAPTPESDAAQTTPAAAAPAASPATATGSQLLLNFVSTSWARVEDAGGKVLLNRVVQAGERQVLDGRPPYSVFLGNAQGVELQFQGRSVDIKRFIRENATARFAVPLATPPAQ